MLQHPKVTNCKVPAAMSMIIFFTTTSNLKLKFITVNNEEFL